MSDQELLLVSLGIWIAILGTWVRISSPRILPLAIPPVALYGLALVVAVRGAAFTSTLGTGANIDVWRADSINLGIAYAAIAAAALMFGIALVATLGAFASNRASRETSPNRDVYAVESRLRIQILPFADRPGVYLGVSVVALGFFAAIYGPAQLVQRNIYLATYSVSELSSVGVLVFPVVALCLTIASAQAQDKLITITATVLALIMWAVVMSTGSRVLAVLPFIYLATRAALQLHVGLIRVTIGAALGVLGLSLALEFRGSAVGHGFIPYFTSLLQNPGTLVSDGLGSALTNIAFSIPLMGAVSLYGSYSIGYLLISINPLPGSIAGWDSISSSVGLNRYVPYSGFGELAYISPVLLATFCALFAVIVAGSIQLFRSKLLGGVLTILFLYSFILLLQYNLRSSFRIVYVLITIIIVVGLYRTVTTLVANRHAAII